MSNVLLTDDFDYELPSELIAQRPIARRDESRLLVLNRSSGSIEHRIFSDLSSYLEPGDLLVANRSRVIPARLHGFRETGGQIELLLVRELTENRWEVLARPGRKIRQGTAVRFPDSQLVATFEEPLPDGEWVVKFDGGLLREDLVRLGETPLPPYIQEHLEDADRYQTVYADREGSVAAPTAGLHFTPELMERLEGAGIGIEYVTLHVGPGTFRPVTANRVVDHRMQEEWGEVPQSVADSANAIRARGGRLVAVGTTSTRLLESACENRRIRPFSGDTDRFIYPGYSFCAIDGLITNFHLPRSTLLMLVSALAGRDLVMEAYEEAIRLRYRFYSFGDAMLIL